VCVIRKLQLELINKLIPGCSLRHCREHGRRSQVLIAHNLPFEDTCPGIEPVFWFWKNFVRNFALHYIQHPLCNAKNDPKYCFLLVLVIKILTLGSLFSKMYLLTISFSASCSMVLRLSFLHAQMGVQGPRDSITLGYIVVVSKNLLPMYRHWRCPMKVFL
jgi:hypothetical protein